MRAQRRIFERDVEGVFDVGPVAVAANARRNPLGWPEQRQHLVDKMRPQIDEQTASILRRLSDNDCHELSRLCALIFEPQDDPLTLSEH